LAAVLPCAAARPHRSRLALAVVAVAGLLALLSKEMAVTLPLLGLALAYAAPAGTRAPRAWSCAVLLAGVVALYGVLRLALVGSFRSYYEAPGGIAGAAANAARFVGDALGLA